MNDHTFKLVERFLPRLVPQAGQAKFVWFFEMIMTVNETLYGKIFVLKNIEKLLYKWQK